MKPLKAGDDIFVLLLPTPDDLDPLMFSQDKQQADRPLIKLSTYSCDTHQYPNLFLNLNIK